MEREPYIERGEGSIKKGDYIREKAAMTEDGRTPMEVSATAPDMLIVSKGGLIEVIQMVLISRFSSEDDLVLSEREARRIAEDIVTVGTGGRLS